jgi:transcription-repair coupling factor (superfamily II helicase)
VLVSTTIIESGLDVPNANTIIINSAQNFGMSDLHQMRGRVGRSNKKAFCKLVAPPLSSLTDDARKRLRTLEQFSDLGSGFKIAMRDLEIRGAGDILGGEQSGFINEIGFDAYQKILAEAVKELKETEFKDLYKDSTNDSLLDLLDECQLDTDLELMIPDEYVNNIEERLRLYQELDAVKNKEELDAFEKGLEDRFGPVPQTVKELLTSMHLRWIAQSLGMEKLVLKMGKMIGYFIANQESPFYQSEQFNKVLMFLRDNPTKATMKQKNDKLSLVFENVKSVDAAIGHLKGMTLEKA